MIPAPRTPADDQARADAIRAAVDAAVAGDRDAFGHVWAAYQVDVFRYVYYRVATRHLAEDLTSETCLRAMRRIETFAWTGHDFGAWLVTIARNLIADHFKSARHQRERVSETGEILDGDKLEPAPEEIVLRDIAAAAVHAALARLNDAQREVLTLRYLQGLSVRETAEAMGKQEGAIKTLQWRAEQNMARNRPLAREAAA